ncbi:MAG: TonB-dependent receptor plug domain-containing protein, partial [Thermodesulfovibrionales bacterium]|nr:TonB-dependent receptor plug domain-containing protein [Thermodesulfovibrionales bacterium]
MKIVILFLLSLLVLSNPLYASDNGAKKIFQLDEVAVSDTVIKQEETTPNMSVIIPELLLQGIGSTLDSALFRQTGIDVRRTQEVGGALDDESIKIRGFGSNRIQLSIDGRVLNNSGTAGGYFIDWSSVTLNNIDRIEVIKGVSDPRYGNILGGVINLVTKKPSDKPLLEAQALYGDFGTRTMSFFHSYKPSRFEYSISGGYTYSDGYLWNGSFTEKNINLYGAYEFPWDGKLKLDLQTVELKKGFIVSNRLSK